MMTRVTIRRIVRRMKYFPMYLLEAQKWKSESCKKCGSIFRVAWQVNDNIWTNVMGRSDGAGGSYCVDCFVKMAEQKGIMVREEQIKLNLFYE